MCLNIGTSKTINFQFDTNGKLMRLCFPILKLFRVLNKNLSDQNYMLKMYRIFEVLRWIGAVFGTASVVQTVNKYGHLLPTMEKHLMESFSSDWLIIAKASSLPGSELTYFRPHGNL